MSQRDTAKAAAALAGTKVVTIPTIASNDSPTSSYTVWYDEEGNCTGFESWDVNPDLVLVDTQVIANGPVAAFVAGMGDAWVHGSRRAPVHRLPRRTSPAALQHWWRWR